MSLVVVSIPLVVEQEHPKLMRTGRFAKVSGIDPDHVRELCERKHNPMPAGRMHPGGHIYVKTYEAFEWLEKDLQIDGVYRERRGV